MTDKTISHYRVAKKLGNGLLPVKAYSVKAYSLDAESRRVYSGGPVWAQVL